MKIFVNFISTAYITVTFAYLYTFLSAHFHNYENDAQYFKIRKYLFSHNFCLYVQHSLRNRKYHRAVLV